MNTNVDTPNLDLMYKINKDTDKYHEVRPLNLLNELWTVDTSVSYQFCV